MTHIGQRLNGKVAFVTGAARGQGRSHALTLADEGADLILLDSVRPIDQVSYAMPEHADLKETARLVEERGRKAVVIEADVRDESMIAAVARPPPNSVDSTSSSPTRAYSEQPSPPGS